MVALIYDILGLSTFYALIKLYEKYNLSKSARFYQNFFPIYSFVLSLIVIIFYLFPINDLLEILISYFSFFPINTSLKIDIDHAYFVFLNVLFIIIFTLQKNHCLKKINNASSNDEKEIFLKNLFFKIRLHFYDYSSSYHMYFLKEEYVPIKIFLKRLYQFNKVITAIEILIILRLGADQKLSFEFYPIVSIVVIGELLFFFEGYTKEEYYAYIISENVYNTIDYEEMANNCKEYFKDHILLEHREYNSFKLDDLKSSVNQYKDISVELETYYNYFKNNKKDDMVMKEYIAKFISNQSVYFNTSFYYDSMPYLFFASVLKLMKSKNVLIIIGKDKKDDQVMNWFKNGIFSICKQPELWDVGKLKYNEDLDVGILTFTDLFDLELIEKNKYFFENVGQVIVIDPSAILMTGQIMLENLALFFKNQENIAYAFFDKNCDGMIDTLSHIFKTNITEVTPIRPEKHNSITMFWKAEDNYIHPRFFNRLTHYLGIGSEMSIIALMNNVKNIKWLSDINFPIVDMKWILNQYAKLIISFSKNKIQISDIEKLDFNTNSLINNYYQDCVIIVEDEDNNGFEISRQINSRIKKNGMLHILMPDYLLRDYMIDNNSIFLNDAKAIPFIVPDYVKTKRNIVLSFLIQMINGPVLLENIKFQLIAHNYRIKGSVKETFINYVATYFTINNDDFEIKEEMYNNEKREYLCIKSKDIVDKYLNELKIAYFLDEDEKQKKNYLGARLKGHIDQSFLIGQYVVLDGKYYEVMHTNRLEDTSQEILVIRRAADHIDKRRYYRQIRKYNLNSFKNDNDVITQKKYINEIEVSQIYADLDVETIGYLECDSLSDICHAVKINVSGVARRIYKNKMVLKIILPECTDNVRITITLILNEIFKTIYANASNYICAITQYNDKEIPEGLIHFNNLDNNDIYIIEDSILDLGYISSFFRNIKRIFGILYDYCDWNAKFYKDKNYLNFGYKKIYKMVSPDGVREYLEKYGFQNNSLTKRRKTQYQMGQMNENQDYCSCCGSTKKVFQYPSSQHRIILCDECSCKHIEYIKEYKDLLDFHKKRISYLFKINYIYDIEIQIMKINKNNQSIFHKSKYGKNIIYIQNNLPKIVAINFIVYELALIWQKGKIDELLAKWITVQYFYWIDEIANAVNLEKKYVEDEKFRELINQFPFSKNKDYSLKATPFNTYE